VELSAKAIASLTSKMALAEDSIVVFNTLGFARTDIAACPPPVTESFRILDSDGSELPYQISFDGKLLFLAKDVPAKGYKSFRIRKGSPREFTSRVQTDGTTFDTPYYTVSFDENRCISRLVHKQSGRAVAPNGEVLGRLFAYEDRPNVYDAWEVKAFYDEKYRTIDDVESCEILETGALRTVMRVVRRFQSSCIEQYYVFYSDLERIDVQYVIDWHEKHILLKADYPVDVNASRATFDIQFGNLERTTHNNTTWDSAQFEVCGHKWADLSDNSFGLSVLNDCKYGWNVKEGHIRPSILRCATELKPNQDREVHNVTYALYPHAGAVQDSRVVQEGYQLNVPMYTAFARAQDGALPEQFSMVSCDAGNVIVETVKKAEDSDALIVRVYETWNRKTDCTLTFGRPIRDAFVTNLLEERDVPIRTEGNAIPLSFKPFEIQTIKVIF
jgi:alpha-mannosidase